MKNDKIKGGKSDKMSITDIAKKHDVSINQIIKQLVKGSIVELEHTDDVDLAMEIATDHLVEFPDYYDRLKKMEEK